MNKIIKIAVDAMGGDSSPKKTIDGIVHRIDEDNLIKGSWLKRRKMLDEIPSPYLNGLLDPFFEGPYMPLLETNRSCPYRCTFCAWGIGTQKLLRFDEERVLKEIEYLKSQQSQIIDMCSKIITILQE